VAKGHRPRVAALGAEFETGQWRLVDGAIYRRCYRTERNSRHFRVRDEAQPSRVCVT